MKRALIDFIIVCLLLLVAGLLVYIGVVAKQEATQCYLNPLKYAAEKLSEENGALFEGQGYFLMEQSPRIYFNSTTVSVEIKPNKFTRANNLNFSEIIKNFNQSQ